MNVHCSHNGFKSVVPSLIPPALLPSTPSMTEAACSVNVYLHVAGYADRVQVTGRGATPQEAAANLRGTIDATKAALGTPVPKSREQRLSELLACGLTKAVNKGDYGLVERLSKAAALVLSGAVSQGEREGMLAVQSASTPSHWYEIDGTACSCPDYLYRHKEGEKAYYCKHALGAMLYRRLEEHA